MGFKKRWKPFRHRLEYGLHQFMMMWISRLPRPGLVVLARFLGWLGSHLIFWEVKKARENLDLVFGSDKSRKEKREIIRESFENAAMIILDYFWSKNFTKETFQEIFEFPDSSRKIIDQLKAQGKGGVALLAHYGNWELLGVGGGFLDIPRLNIIVRPLKNPLLDGPVNRYRSLSGNRVIKRDGYSMLRLFRALKRGEFAVLVIDQNVSPEKGGIFAPFFGLPTATTKAAAVLHLRTGAPLLPVVCERRPAGKYIFRADPPFVFEPSGDFDADVERITERCNKTLEDTIRKCPGPWLWSYKRWRIRPTLHRGRYPSYSKPTKKIRQESQ